MSEHAHTEAAEQRAFSIGTLIAAAALALFTVSVLIGAWFAAVVTSPVAVPSLVGLPTAQASRLLAELRLKDGAATYDVTSDFPAGTITGQQPGQGAPAAVGGTVNVRVAVPPRAVVVPDLRLVDSELARTALSQQLLSAKLLYAYSTDIESGRVIEQLPRAGDSAMTGSQAALVVSLGPGTGGKTVPLVVGRDLAQAQSLLGHATFFASLRSVIATDAPAGQVVDQLPSAGSRVGASSEVILSVAQ